MELTIHSPEELDKAVTALLDFAGGRKLMAFSGEIGAGKTTFIQAFCRHFQVRENVASPSFSLINEYTYRDAITGEEQYIYHLDLYRLKKIEEALDIGIEEYLYSGRYCLIEWPELIEPLLPEETVRINIEIIEDSARKILF
jgi:tRNA threonylcarbamoyladenosine biosynthesis protein TsaE